MHDIIKALDIALQFTPDTPVPGLNVVLFDSHADHCFLYATDGIMMIKIKLATPGSFGQFFAPAAALTDAIKQLSGAQEVSLTVWGDDLMIMSEVAAPSIHRAHEDFSSVDYEPFFSREMSEVSMTLDMVRVQGAVATCSDIIPLYKGCDGDVFGIRMSSRSGKDGGKEKFAIISPKITPGMLIVSVEIIVMGVKL